MGTSPQPLIMIPHLRLMVPWADQPGIQGIRELEVLIFPGHRVEIRN